MSVVMIVAGLTLMAVSCTSLYWLICQYEARIAALEAQLAQPCPGCQAAARGEAWDGHWPIEEKRGR
jgi:hypothetical protein